MFHKKRIKTVQSKLRKLDCLINKKGNEVIIEKTRYTKIYIPYTKIEIIECI